MRIASLVPAATEIVCALGLEQHLVGVTQECDFPPAARGKPVVVESLLAPGQSSRAIDAAVREAASEGRSLYRVRTDLLRELRPDLVITQSLCEVCAASRPEVRQILDALDEPPIVLTLGPATLDEAVEDIVRVGEATDREKRARSLAAALRARVLAVEDAVRRAPRPRVAFLEWLDPPMQGGHWVPDMVARAGGLDVLGQPGEHARAIRWDDVRAAGPEVLAMAPCGFGLAGAVREAQVVLRNAGSPMRALAFDGNAHFSRPGPRLVDGLEVLASALHPELVEGRFPWSWAELQAPVAGIAP